MVRQKKGNPVHGWLVFDKPQDMTSAQAVGYVKRVFNAQKAGHGGTLDPMATGVLPIALGEATKTMNYVLNADKHYQFTVTFGVQTNTDDAMGETIKTSDSRPVKEEIEEKLPLFKDKIRQTPPIYSAIKINGKAAYARARGGENVELQPRTVTVHRLDLVAFDGNKAEFVLHGSKGIYVRSIARDLGEMLGCYGHVSALRRLQAGKFTENMLVTKEKLDSCQQNGQDVHTFLLDAGNVLDDIPAYEATVEEARQLYEGRQLVRVHLRPGLMKVMAPGNRLASLVEIGMAGEMKVVRNFNM